MSSNGSGSRPISSYRDLVVWQRGLDLVDVVYKNSARWPAAEMYGLSAQIRRAAVSVPANIAEGQGRNGRREFIHHLGIAHGSLCEVETMIILAQRLGFMGPDDQDAVLELTREVGRLLNGLIRSLDPPRQAK